MIRNVFWGRGGRLVVEILARLGVRYIYSIPGAQTLSIWDGLHNREDISLIVPNSEWDGVYTAMQYSHETGILPVVLNTVGPGCVNELPAMAVARKNKIPLLFLTPSQPQYKKKHIDTVFQGLRQSEILDPFVAQTFRVIETTRNWGSLIKHAVTIAREPGNGPVRLEIEFSLLFKLRREKLIRKQ